MHRGRVVISLLAVVVALVLQTTVFGDGGIRPFGVAPALVTLVVIALGPYIETEYHLLLGFTAGLLTDLMGSGTLGLWAMTLTTVAYVSARLRTQIQENLVVQMAIVFGLTVLGQVLFVLLGTLFGQNLVGDSSLVAKIFLPALWNLVLAVPVLWVFGALFRQRDRGWAT
ncbi:MAG: rod shape-determining protein MreD [Acidimicrobiia bacterium]|nr:rod shape-determining protein MreD [Acidimicrobiia bacterium]